MKITGVAKGIIWLAAAYVYAGLVGGRLPYFILYCSIGIMAVSIFWARLLSGVQINSSLHANHSDVGKVVIMKLQVVNSSLFPIPWVQCRMKLPEVFSVENEELALGFSLKSREKVEFDIPLTCQIRGVFQWGRLELEGGDIFGLLHGRKCVETPLSLLVRPKADYLGNLFGGVENRFGDRVSSTRPGRQVSEFRGVRGYTSGESLSRIHWKMSVRLQRLMVKEYDQSMQNDVMLFLDLSSPYHFGAGPDNSIERGVAATASLATTAILEGLNVGCTICTDELLVVPPGRSKGHLGLILDNLAKASNGQGMPVAKALLQQAFDRPRGTLLVLVTPDLAQDLTAALVFLAGKGYKVFTVLLKTEDFGRPGVDFEGRDQAVTRLQYSGARVLMIDRDTDLRTLFGGVQHEAC